MVFLRWDVAFSPATTTSGGSCSSERCTGVLTNGAVTRTRTHARARVMLPRGAGWGKDAAGNVAQELLFALRHVGTCCSADVLRLV